MHFLTNYFLWYFVERFFTDGRKKSSLWRSETHIGDLALYMPFPDDLLKRVDEAGNICANSRAILKLGRFLPEQEDMTIPARFFDCLDSKLCDVLNNEMCFDGNSPDGVGRLIYEATLRAFQASRGE